MKRSFHILILLMAVLFAPTTSAQWEIDFAGKDFFQLREHLRDHYDSLATVGDSSAFHEGGPYSRFRRWNEYWSLRLKDGTNFDDYFEAEALSRAALLTKSAGNTDPWHEIGPKDKPSLGVMDIGQGSQPGIGPIQFISFSNINADQMLCGSVIGGVWYTNDEGMNWVNGGSDTAPWKRSGCRYAVFKVGDPATWYAVNSEYFRYSGAILRGSNYGANWEVIADHSDFPASGIWTKVNKLVTDHANPDVLYVAAENRLWKSTDVNSTDPIWNEVFIQLPISIINHPIYGTNSSYVFTNDRFIHDLEIDPLNSNKLYATIRFTGEASPTQRVHFWRIMKSVDGGSTWLDMPNQPVHLFLYDSVLEVEKNADLVTIEMSKAQPNWLYVFYNINDQDPLPPNNGLVDQMYRISDAANGIWDLPLRQDILGVYGQGNAFGVDQVNGEDLWIENSFDLGRYSAYVNNVWLDYGDGHANELDYHVDVEDFVGDPDDEGVVWMANHGGIHRSADGGANWEWRGSGLAVAEVYRMANSYSEPDRLITGLFHDGSVLTEGSYGPNWQPDWKQLGGGDGQQPLIDHDEGNWVFWSSQGARWNKSDDYGNTRLSMSAWGYSLYWSEWETAGAIDYGVPNAIYQAGWNNGTEATNPMNIKRTFDRGMSWETISDFPAILGTGRKIVWRVFASPYDPNQLLVYFPDGHRVFRTRIARANATAVISSWEEIYVPRSDAWISDIDFDIENPDVLYFAYSSSAADQPVADGDEMLFKVDYYDPADPMDAISIDLSNWGGYMPVFLDDQLPNTGVGSEGVVLERGSNGGIYVATDLGVYYTNNEFLASNSGWKRLGASLPYVTCRGLEINYKANKLRAGLSGRGVWEHDLWCPEEGDLLLSYHLENGFFERMNNVTSTASINSTRNITYRAGSQIRLLPGFRVSEGGKFHAFIHPCNQGGNSFKSLPVGPNGGNFDVESEKHKNVGLVIYPNPNKGSLKALVPDGGSLVTAVLLYDSYGREIAINSSLSQSSVDIQILAVSTGGLYFLRSFHKDGSVHTSPFILQP